MTRSRLTESKRRLMELLKRRGPITATELAEALGLTDVAIRQHLGVLAENGLVASEPQSPPGGRGAGRGRGRGRPSVAWSLTELGGEIFPDHHSDLTVDLLNAMRKTLGEEALLRIVEVRAKDQVTLYKKRVPARGSLRKRVESLAAQRTSEGYMAEVVQEKPGRYLLIEHHCPICDAAKCCQGLCRAELDVFRKTLGRGVTIERIEHLLTEGDRCVYRIERK